MDVPIAIAGLVTKMDLTVTSLLHEVDLVLGMNWLQLVNPGIVSVCTSQTLCTLPYYRVIGWKDMCKLAQSLSCPVKKHFRSYKTNE